MTPDSAEPSEAEAYNSDVDLLTLPIFTRYQLSQFNGQTKPEIYVAIKGYIYDVTHNSKSYGVGKSYHKLVGKDVSRLLGTNKLSLDKEESKEPVNTWDTSGLTEKQLEAVDKWVLFFKKRYRIVGVVVDHQTITYSQPT